MSTVIPRPEEVVTTTPVEDPATIERSSSSKPTQVSQQQEESETTEKESASRLAIRQDPNLQKYYCTLAWSLIQAFAASQQDENSPLKIKTSTAVNWMLGAAGVASLVPVFGTAASIGIFGTSVIAKKIDKERNQKGLRDFGEMILALVLNPEDRDELDDLDEKLISQQRWCKFAKELAAELTMIRQDEINEIAEGKTEDSFFKNIGNLFNKKGGRGPIAALALSNAAQITAAISTGKLEGLTTQNEEEKSKIFARLIDSATTPSTSISSVRSGGNLLRSLSSSMTPLIPTM